MNGLSGCEMVALMGDAASAAACYDAAVTRTGIWAALSFLVAVVFWVSWEKWLHHREDRHKAPSARVDRTL